MIGCGDGGTDCVETVNHGTSIALSAVAAQSSTFGGWGGACSGTGTCTVNVTEARDVTANFALKTYALSVNRSGDGNGSVSSTGIACGADCTETFNHGTALPLSASPNADSDFTGWSGACSGTGPCSVTMTQAREFNHGTSVTLTGNPINSFWGSWVEASSTKCRGNNASCTFTVTGDQTETAVFWHLH